MGSNETWLRQQLSAALGWDDVIMEGVMDVIVNSKSEADIQDVVEVGAAAAFQHSWLVVHRPPFRAGC
jgi:hypothetical protein